jgi:hypothetical protein
MISQTLYHLKCNFPITNIVSFHKRSGFRHDFCQRCSAHSTIQPQDGRGERRADFFENKLTALGDYLGLSFLLNQQLICRYGE